MLKRHHSNTMKKFTAIIGSPRKGNALCVAHIFAKQARELGWEVNIFHIPDYNITACNGCYQVCTTKPGINCIYEDDMDEIIKIMLMSDLTLFSVPLYNGSFPGIMSSFLERCLPLWEGHQTEETMVCDRVLTQGLKAVLSVVQEETTPNAAFLAFEVLKHNVGHLYGYEILDMLNITGVRKPRDLEKNTIYTEQCRKTARHWFKQLETT